MPTTDEIPWELLLTKLQRSDDARVSYAEVLAVGAEPTLCIREQVLTYGKDDDYEPPGCEHGCTPNLNYDLRAREALVGVACPQEPPCWPGWTWIRRSAVEGLRCQATQVLPKLAARNGLAPLPTAVPSPFIGVGLLRRRGLEVPVVWLRAARAGFEALCRGLRADLGGDGLIVLVGRPPKSSFAPADRIAVGALAFDARGRLDLTGPLDALTPDYRAAVLDDPTLDLDYVRLRFSTRPEEHRHVVEINGRDFGGFQKSDVKFLRLLLLAAARKAGEDDGWLDKSRLRDGNDKDPAVADLREDLSKYALPGLSEDERKALIRAKRGSGRIRLGVPPENIELDASLAELAFVSAPRKKDGTAARVTKAQKEGLRNAALLLRDCRRLGVPGDVEDESAPPTSVSRANRGGRSTRR